MLHVVDDLMAIGEFSERSGLSAKRLRRYAAEGLLTPAAVDASSGYRYYSPGQVVDARLIDALRQASVPLADIRAFMHRPSRRQLDAWEGRLHTDADARQRALTLARQLITASADPLALIVRHDTEEELMITLRMAGRSDIGRVRENNEDAIVTSDRLALVADGMGGHPGGEIASEIAADVVSTVFTGRSMDELEAAVRAANWAIRDHARVDPGLEGMGTTICAAALLSDGDLAVVHVGDSRAYLWHRDALTQLTRDHSVTAELIERGELREEDEPRHPHHGVLTRALGVGPEVEIDRSTLDVEAGDRIVVCSDGLFNEVSSEDMAAALGHGGGVADVADRLIDQAVDRGGRDNVSVVVAEVIG